MPPDPEDRPAAQPPPLPPDPDGPVLAELEKLQKPRNNWIQAIVIFGVSLAFVAWRNGDERLLKPARLFLAVNGFNLLPLLPLDGGRVFDALFYGEWRHLLVHVRATAPDEESARRVASELDAYFLPAGQSALRPPWDAGALSPEELPASGSVERKGRVLLLHHLQFNRLDRGLPALLQFLCVQGFAPVRYGIDPKSH